MLAPACGAVNTQCQPMNVMETLCRRHRFKPDSRLRAVLAALSPPDGEKCVHPASCPAVYTFLGAYLERAGFDGEAIRRQVSDFRAEINRQVSLTGINDVTAYVTEYIRRHAETFSACEEGREEKPAHYYKAIYEDREQMFRHFPYSLEEKLTRAVIAADEPAALRIFKEINDAGGKAVLSSDSVRSAKNSVICSCVLLTRAAIQAGVAPDEAFSLSDAVIKHIEDFNTRWDVLNYEEDILIMFIALIKRGVFDTVSLTTRRAIRFIDAHLSGKLSLPQIAEYAGVNQNYLSGLFRREMNMPLSEYIAKRKIQESVYFIKHTDYAVSDIAALYGFSDQSYYTAVFRKVMGTTPAAYRAGEKAN